MLAKIKQYFFNILISIDQLANTVAGGNPDETISSRLGRNYPNSELRKLVDLMATPFMKNHCKEVSEKGDSGKEVLK